MSFCKLCKSGDSRIIYKGKIRNGGLGKYTEDDVAMYQCNSCNVIWHDNVICNSKEYYESNEYRDALEGSADEEQFYALHDKESLNKFEYTGTTIYRDKVVADIGCGCGAFLDFIKGVAQKVIAIEPSAKYRKIMDRKGFFTYPYADDAKNDYTENVDVVVSFDVIEHVESPQKFVQDCFDLLKPGGQAVIGTPTDAPIMRELLGEIYERKLLFSTQHIWIFSEKNLKDLTEKAGFSDVKVKYFQRYGIGNMLGWVRDKEPCTEINREIFCGTLDSAWKSECEQKGLADYIVLYLKK